MTFAQLHVRQRFVFASETDPRFMASGLARGPWIKLSSRKYRLSESASNRQGAGYDHTVGTTKVEVEPR